MTELIIAAIGSSAFTALISAWFLRRKTKAESVDILNDSTLKWAEAMRKDIEFLKKELEETRDRLVQEQEENVNLKVSIGRLSSNDN
jgi:hypothetical protein